MPRRRRTDSAAKRDPIQEAIALRAYELYLGRGQRDGHAVEDWLEAERELAAAADSIRLPPAAEDDRGARR